MMSISEFKKLPLQDQFYVIRDSDLYNDQMLFKYELFDNDDLDDEINDAITFSSEGWRDLRTSLNHVYYVIEDSDSGLFYKVLGDHYWDEPQNLTKEILWNIISEYSDTKEYKELFSYNASFDGMECLL